MDLEWSSDCMPLRANANVPEHAAPNEAASQPDDSPVTHELPPRHRITAPHPCLGGQVSPSAAGGDPEVPDRLGEPGWWHLAESVCTRRHHPTGWRPEAAHNTQDELFPGHLPDQGKAHRAHRASAAPGVDLGSTAPEHGRDPARGHAQSHQATYQQRPPEVRASRSLVD